MESQLIEALLGALSAVAQVVMIWQKHHPSQPVQVSVSIELMRSQTIAACRRLEAVLIEIRGDFDQLGLEPGQSIRDRLADLRWFNFRTKGRLKAMAERVEGIQKEVLVLVDQAYEAMICSEALVRNQEAVQQAEERRREITERHTYDEPLEELFSQFHEIAEGLRRDLGGSGSWGGRSPAAPA